MRSVVDGERIDPTKEAVKRLGSVDSASASADGSDSTSTSARPVGSAVVRRAVVERLCGRCERFELVEHAHGVVGPNLDGEAGGVRWPAAIDGAACSVERVEQLEEG